jgi:hypothetical protein
MNTQERADKIYNFFADIDDSKESALFLCDYVISELTYVYTRCKNDDAISLMVSNNIDHWHDVKEIIENK